MTTREFSDTFDTLIGSHSLRGGFGDTIQPLVFDEYEKSVFLTKAQNDIVRELYTGKGQYGEGFEKTEELRRYLDSLIRTSSISDRVSHEGVSGKSVFFQLPDDLWFITYEAVTFDDESLGCLDGTTADVVPVTQDSFHRMSDNPFRRPSKKRVFRLDSGDRIVEIVSDYNVGSYLVRYLSKPEPIVLVRLDGLDIDGVSDIHECTLDQALHDTILVRAVRYALESRSVMSGNKQNNV